MARAFGASGLLDIRSVSILFDVAYSHLEWTRKKPEFRRERDDLPLRSDDDFDSSESWLLLMCSMLVTALALGVLHSCAFLGDFGAKDLDLTIGQMALMSTVMYAMFCFTSPLCSVLTKSWTPRLTITTGFLMGFFGLVLMSFQGHKFLHLIGCLFLGPGCALVQTAAGCCIVDMFKAKISIALFFLSLSSPIGTLLFVPFSYYIGINTLFKYKWMMLTYAMFFLTAISMSKKFPRTIHIEGHQDSIRAVEVAYHIKRCLRAARASKTKGFSPPTPPLDEDDVDAEVARAKKKKVMRELTCTCACFVDVGVLKDARFCLWMVVAFSAMLTFYVPHVCFVTLVRFELGYGYRQALVYVCAFSLGCVLGRTIAFFGDDFSFMSCRTMFQAGLLGTAIIYFTIHKAETWGWMLAVHVGLGISEGFLVILIPRLTLHIFPRKYLASVWRILLPTHGVAVLIGPFLMVMARNANEGEIFLACVLVGVVQIVAVLLSMILSEHRPKPKTKTSNGAKFNLERRSPSPSATTIEVQPAPSGSSPPNPAYPASEVAEKHDERQTPSDGRNTQRPNMPTMSVTSKAPATPKPLAPGNSARPKAPKPNSAVTLAKDTPSRNPYARRDTPRPVFEASDGPTAPVIVPVLVHSVIREPRNNPGEFQSPEPYSAGSKNP